MQSLSCSVANYFNLGGIFFIARFTQKNCIHHYWPCSISTPFTPLLFITFFSKKKYAWCRWCNNRKKSTVNSMEFKNLCISLLMHAVVKVITQSKSQSQVLMRKKCNILKIIEKSLWKVRKNVTPSLWCNMQLFFMDILIKKIHCTCFLYFYFFLRNQCTL